MAFDTVITAGRLTRLGITGDIATALTDLTLADAAELMLDDLVLLLGVAAAQSQGTISYTINGRSTSIGYDQAMRVVALLRSAKNANGPAIMGVMFP